ncbi:MAG: HD domain-containing protein [Flavobacterium sp.]
MKTNKLKIFNDPIYGFINIPSTLIFDLIEHSYFQRLRRITQMGLSYLVYPGAHHTRFHHALGAMHLMQKAVKTLQYKGVSISEEEEEALYIAILLHDIGHGPFSHTLEESIVEGMHHEQLSLFLIEELNNIFEGKLSLAIQIFTQKYPRKFLYQLISSQLDMDRLDYLKRDSFYSGVAEGNINSDRLIQMLHVVDEQLVIDEKAIYSIEKFLMARRLMYWQAYLHKTSLTAELMLTKVLKRAKKLIQSGEYFPISQPLFYFMKNSISSKYFSIETLNQFALLDDIDIWNALKIWSNSDDFVLNYLSNALLNRNILKVEWKKCSKEEVELIKQKTADFYKISLEETKYLVFSGNVKNNAYNKAAEPIWILKKDKTIEDFIDQSEQLQSKSMSKIMTKYYICYPKMIDANWT